jgi:cytochrome c peroxidase
MQKKLTILFILFVACLQFAWQAGELQKTIAATPLRKWLLTQLQSVRMDLKKIQTSQSAAQKRINYQQARKHYKHVEFFIEYYSPLEAKLYINGPLVPKHEIDLGKRMLPPQGFQRIEEIVYSTTVLKEKTALQKEISLLTKQLLALEQYYSSAEITDDVLLDMCQLQLFRMASLNLNGYDATISQTNIQETAWVLEGVEQVINFFKPYSLQDESINQCYLQLQSAMASGAKLLNDNKEYSSFQRIQFITGFINPANQLLVNFHNLLKLPWNKNKKALNLENGFLFGKESFNLQFFSIYYDDTLHLQEQASIGKKLFNDPILSGNNQYSCASCHNADKAFTDGLAKSISIDGSTHLKRNAPTLLNVIYQKAFFHDGRAYELEQQVADVVHNPAEMQSSLADVVERLQKNSTYKTLFATAFAGTMDENITEYAIQKSLTEYEKTLLSFNSRFDEYLHGNEASLNSREINGYNIFAGKALCGSCHFLPLFNGTVPPYFTDSEFEVIGTPEKEDNKKLDGDEGRFAVTGLTAHKYSFKTPTVRNIALTAPYMHNGAYTKLEDIIEFYHRGGGKGFGLHVPNQTLPFDSLKLTLNEKEDILLFLHTLTDTVSFRK